MLSNFITKLEKSKKSLNSAWFPVNGWQNTRYLKTRTKYVQLSQKTKDVCVNGLNSVNKIRLISKTGKYACDKQFNARPVFQNMSWTLILLFNLLKQCSLLSKF